MQYLRHLKNGSSWPQLYLNCRTKTIETFVTGATVLAINENIVNETIALRKIKKMKLPDAIIAATALVYNYTLLSRNLADFKNIPGLIVIDPHTL